MNIFKYGRLKLSTYIHAYATSENAKLASISLRGNIRIYVKG